MERNVASLCTYEEAARFSVLGTFSETWHPETDAEAQQWSETSQRSGLLSTILKTKTHGNALIYP
jgi:hypothetical protein